MNKVIHYCWFGRNPLPPLALKCIESWRKFLPDYEIKEWNEDNFDVNMIPYTQEAYKAKKYAFVSDYARFWVVYHYGGLYFDVDVEIIAPLYDIIKKGSFMGCEPTKEGVVCNPGLGFGAEVNHVFLKQMLDVYNTQAFDVETIKTNTIVTHTTNELLCNGFKKKNAIQTICGVTIYPTDYFCPIRFGKKRITKNTRTIHHYYGSWLSKTTRLKIWVAGLIGERLTGLVQKILSRE